MNKKAMFWIGAAGLAISGCATVQRVNPFVTKSDCYTNVCHVSIPVNNCNVSDPGYLYVHTKGQIEIIFTLQGGGHDFARDGIKFKTGQGTVFTNPRHSAHGEFRWTDNYTTAGTYEYTITAVKDGSPGTCRPVDPDIVNG